MKRFFLMAAAMLVALVTGANVIALEAPLDIVRQTTDQVVARVQGDKDALRNDPAKMYSLVSEMIFPHFDFNVMSQFVLGPEWKSAQASKRTQFVAQFRKLLVRTYATALLEYSDQKIEYPAQGTGADNNGKTATVRQDVTQPDSKILPIVYRLHSKTGDWKVFDVSVDGVSLVKTYRSSFTSVLKQGGIDKLIADLTTKNQEIGQ
ncbi:MAG: ABC transporter substrate-binding protein [Gammaproteobacteria bacterium]|nr:ABC transporter substrate-binding protein [Gammaproteobacteria bacterium]